MVSMALDGITIANVVQELQKSIAGGKINKIAQPENDELLLTIKGNDRQTVRLLLSADASLPLIYTTAVNRPSPAVAPNFCMLLRKHIGSGKIVSVTQPGLERIICFLVEHYDELGDLRRKKLILELMGKHSNIIFCDENNTIIDSIKHISSWTSSVREVLPGRAYFIPDTTHKLDPLSAGEDDFDRAVFSKGMPLPKAIYTSFTGISPQIAQELLFRASLSQDRSATALPPMEQVHLRNLFFLMMEDVKQGNFEPNMILNDEGDPVEFSAIPMSMYADMTVQKRESMCSLLEEYYDLKNRVTRIHQKSTDLRRIVTTSIDRSRRKLALQEKQMTDTQKRDQYRLYGELLHTYGYEAQAGARFLDTVNYYNGEPVRIPLDETKTAQENAQRYFDKYSKMKRTKEALDVQIEETKAELEHLESVLAFLNMTLSENDLQGLKEELILQGYIRRKGPAGKKAKITSAPYHYRSRDDYDIYVGKNNLQNDELTFKFASGSDWWFHAKKAPGSHVILKSRGSEVPDRAFEDAARLAAYYSANRAAGKVEIDYVLRKEVKKPAGAKPGFVVYYTNYSMVIDTDISGLQLISD